MDLIQCRVTLFSVVYGSREICQRIDLDLGQLALHQSAALNHIQGMYYPARPAHSPKNIGGYDRRLDTCSRPSSFLGIDRMTSHNGEAICVGVLELGMDLGYLCAR